ncbi:cyclic nucleotide-binding domain-containing protein [Caulobacter sp. SLTY]|uniref:cyclic nucleotide-binding domain-containing protein n=1 Tax=Caulobacter sp. SLTY TaxID=2683262 RepID=UPI0014123337|nr:cyclic nucleotide-binding domain-containing protein [Caulobacter sp. SLTY]
MAAPFAFWSDAALSRLAALSSMVWHNPGEVIARSQEPPQYLWIVAEGCLEVAITVSNGDRFLADLLTAPQVMGLTPALDDRAQLFTATARGRTRLVRIPAAAFRAELEADAALLVKMLRLVCLRARMEHDRTYMNVINDNNARVAKAITYLGRRPSLLEGAETPLPAPITYDDIADFLGLSYSAVVRSVQELIAAGAVKKQYRGFIIADPAALLRVVESLNPLHATARDYLAQAPRG